VATRYEEKVGWTEITKKNKKIKSKYFVGPISKKIWYPWNDASVTVTWAKQHQCSKYAM